MSFIFNWVPPMPHVMNMYTGQFGHAVQLATSILTCKACLAMHALWSSCCMVIMSRPISLIDQSMFLIRTIMLMRILHQNEAE